LSTDFSHRTYVLSLIIAGNTRQSVEISTGTRIEPREGGIRPPGWFRLLRPQPAWLPCALQQREAVSLADASIATPSLRTTRSSRNLVSPPCGQYSHGTARLVGLSTPRRPLPGPLV